MAEPVEAPGPAPRGDAPHGDVSVDARELSAELLGGDERASDPDVAAYALRLGDDALILAQNLCGWIARAPELEEDVALGNIALDLLGHARSLLRYAGSHDGRSEDDLAYGRDEAEFRSAWLFELPNGDFAHTIVRQLLASTYLLELYRDLTASADPVLAAVAAKAEKEVDYHRDHAVQWMLRLAGGTDESRRRLLVALDDTWPFLDELFRDDALHDRLEGVAVRPSTLRARADAVIDAVLAEEDVPHPDVAASSAGGRRGIHHPAFGPLLAEMQVLARRHPGATW
ncbi:1,2-phenylacetyl-CoA epoxidase subunit PaaC [Microbacterium sp. 22296]|uniref:1,2-phenylacetyl-CoA epoxidase subunit PaaC n=1 Tax=Microbacterium sp. 22296 TaxID=3453903 RepID=UPI003F82749A